MSAYLGGPSDDAAEAQLVMQAAETARLLSDGAKNMLLHIARVNPLPKPFPPHADGRRHLAELLFGDLIAPVSEGEFAPTDFGWAVVRAVPRPPSDWDIDFSGEHQ